MHESPTDQDANDQDANDQDSADQGRSPSNPLENEPEERLFAPLSERPVQPVPDGRDQERSIARLYWFLAFLTALVVLRVVIPNFVEQIQYSLVRGRQRAEVEIATEGLRAMPLKELSEAYQLVSKKVGPSVVHINVLGATDVAPDELAAIFGSPMRRGEGSGVIVDAAGFVVTNNHVVAGAQQIGVTLSDGRVVRAELIGADPATDLAVLRLDVTDVEPAEWGNSDELAPGALVWAVGSPFGLQQTITFGILSGKNREGIAASPYLNFLQTDAAVNPGNSGGPLVDASGRIIGINTAIVGDVYQGISFAIPSSVARRIYDRIRATGRVDRGWLGVALMDIDEDVAREFQLGVSEGALVSEMANANGVNSPAMAAGIRPGDVIVAWNGHQIRDSLELRRLVALTEVGASAEVRLMRGGTPLTLNVQVGHRPQEL